MGKDLQHAIRDLVQLIGDCPAADLASLPAYRSTILGLTVALARRTLSYTRNTDWRPFETSQVDKAEAQLRAVGGLSALMLVRAEGLKINEGFERPQGKIPMQSGVDLGGMEAFFNLDLFGWEGLFQAAQEPQPNA
jgi:hypothetical protein